MTTTTSRRLAAAAVSLGLLTTAACGNDDTAAPAAEPSSATTLDTDTGDTDATDTDSGDTDTSDTDNSDTDNSAGGDASALDTQLPELGDEEIEISFESYNFLLTGAGADAMHQLIDEFEAAYPNITVERRQPASIEDLAGSLQQAIVAGNPPTVAQTLFNIDLIANQFGASSWNDIVGDDTLAAFFDGTLHDQHPVHPRAATLGDLDGETYLIPFVFSTPTLFVNTSLFEEAGLDPTELPSTWTEVVDAAEAVTANTDGEGFYQACTGAGGFGWCYQAILKSNGATPISSDLTEIDFDSPESIEVAEFFAEMVESGLHPDMSSTDAADLFLRGELAMFLNSAVYTGAVLGASAAGGWNMDATGLPAFDGKPVVPTNSGSGLAMFADDDLEKRAGWELVKFLTSDHAYTIITSQIGYLPLRNGIVEDEDHLADWLEANSFLQDNLDQLDQLEPWLIPPGTEGNQITTIWMDAVEEVFYRGADAAATLAEAEATSLDLMP